MGCESFPKQTNKKDGINQSATIKTDSFYLMSNFFDVNEAFETRIPLHRLAETDEIKGLALYLASPASSFVTGSQMVIDGGAMLGMAD